MMIARLVTEADWPVFLELTRQNVHESMPAEVLDVCPFEEEVVRANFDAYLTGANPTIWVCDQRRDLVGFLLATASQYRFGHGFYATQEILFVRPDYRGTRAAVILTQQLVRWADQLGALEITGGNDNGLFTEETRRLLEHFGFEHCGNFMRRVKGRDHGQKRR